MFVEKMAHMHHKPFANRSKFVQFSLPNLAAYLIDSLKASVPELSYISDTSNDLIDSQVVEIAIADVNQFHCHCLPRNYAIGIQQMS